MKSFYFYSLLSFLSILFAFGIFVIANNVIIIRYGDTYKEESVIEKKQVTFFYFHKKKWKTDVQDLLWTHNIADNIYHTVNTWLALVYEEEIFNKKISLQSALLSPSNTIYLSFDRNILQKESSIFLKWMLIEGLLKTVNNLNTRITSVQFLVHHKFLHDNHLDFSKPWPIHGFTNSGN